VLVRAHELPCDRSSLGQVKSTPAHKAGVLVW
jgi:hypothetical protein